MEFNIRKGNSWSVIISFTVTLIILLIGVFIHIINADNLIITPQSVFSILINNRYIWILVFQLILFPVIVYLYTSHQRKIFVSMASNIMQQEKKSKSVISYIDKLIHDEYNAEIEGVEKNDSFAISLINLRDTLKRNKGLVAQQRNEDENRNWHAEGHTKFGEILRSNNDFETLAFNVIKELTEYIGAIQGGFYHLEEKGGEKYFNLIAFYAYGRKKYADNKIPLGRGLIGTAAKEGKTIHLNKLPEGYIRVTSGLGQTTPREIVLTPLISEEQQFGVLEIASLKHFSKDHIEFIEKVAESIASTLSTVRINLQTANLLEESKEQAQTLSAQEEEMRQNLEELKATQEEAARQSDQFLKLENTVNHTMIRAEYDINGTLIYANTNFLNKLDYTSNSQVEGKHVLMFIEKKDKDRFENIWKELADGGKHFEGYMNHVTKSGKDLWTIATYSCIRNNNGEVDKILFLAFDTTEQKKVMLNLEGVAVAADKSSIKMEFDLNGNLKTNSELFLDLFKYKNNETAGLNVFDLIDPLELENFNKKWENIVNGINFGGQFRVRTKNKSESWIKGMFSAIYNMYEEIDKIIFIGHDITTQKKMEVEFINQNDVLKKQKTLLKESENELNKKLRAAKLELQGQFKEIESVKTRIERTLEGALDAIVQTSQNNKIIFYNKAAEKLLGYTKEEVIGNHINMLFSEDTSTKDEFVAKYIGEEDNKLVGVRKEVKIRHKNGNELSVLILLSTAQVDRVTSYTSFIQTI